MAVQIQFDASGVPLLPHLILATRSGHLIREIPANEMKFMETLVSGSEFSFAVYKENCLDRDGNIDETFWRQVTDFKLAYCKDFDRWYELKVDMTESTETVKSVIATSLGEAELGQTNVYGIEINTETDIARDDYEPTVLYSAGHPEKSLIDRLLYKAPHYRVKHVDESIASIQRTFAFDGKTVYDCFSEVSQEIGCLFLYDCTAKEGGGVDRTISVYDLEYHCPVCGQRGEYMPVCTNCGYHTVPGYGTDTTVFVARENLAQEITYSTNTDAVKNCFRLEAGDDLMTAAIVACNPNGSQYIWQITDEMKDDMSQALRNKLADYNGLYDYYQNEATYSPPSVLRTNYNSIISRYASQKTTLTPIPETITGFPAVMQAYFDTIDLEMFLEDEMMPGSLNQPTTAAQEAAKLTNLSLSPVAVANLSACTAETAASAVVGMARCIVRGNYQVKAVNGSISAYGQYKQWTGKLSVTNYGDEEDTAETGTLTILIDDDLERYIKQKIDRMIAQTEDGAADITSLFKLSGSAFAAELKKYCRQRLLSFREACQAALDILIQQGVADEVSWVSEENNLYDNLYTPYRNKLGAIESEIAYRSAEIKTAAGSYDANGGLLAHGMQSRLNEYMNTVRAALGFEDYLGTELWQEFAAYRREDLYKNDNYISDGLSNYDLMVYAQRFMDAAKNEIYKSAQLQHSITASLNNLLAMEEFQPLRQKFRVGNWIRVKADGKVYRLRLSEYTIDYDSWGLEVTFTDLKEGASASSDLESLLNSMKSMSTSYGAVTRSAKDGEKGKGLLDRWVNEGLALTTQIVGGAQNQEFVMDETGFTGKELIPETGEYSPEQIKIISHGVYMTDNGWVTAKAALGRFRMVNPQNNWQVEDRFGVIADTLVGNLILSQEIGIYNSDGTMTMDENGFVLTTEHIDNSKVFTIRRHEQDGSYSNIVSLDASGNLVLNNYNTKGEVAAAIELSEEGIKTYVGDNFSEKGYTVAEVDVEYISWTSDSSTPPQDASGWATTSPAWEYGKYIWQRTKTTDGEGDISYSDPVCIQGSAASVYSIESSDSVVVCQEDGTFKPSSVTFNAVRQVGNSSSGSYSGRFIIQTTTNNSTWTTRYTSSSNESSKSYTIPSGVIAVRCSLYLAGGTTTLLDRQTVPVVSDGKSAYTVILTNENHTFAGDASSALASSAECSVIAFHGNTQVAATIGSITGAPTGMSVTRSNNGTTSAKFTVSVTSSFTTRNGVLNVPVTVDGQTFNMKFTYSLTLIGEQGDDGIGIKSIVEQYYLSTSSSSCTGGTWEYTPAQWTYGKYYWTRSQITWDDNKITYTTAVLARGMNEANEQAYLTNQNLTTNYSTTTQTREMISSEVHSITQGPVVTESENKSPYPYALTSSNSNFDMQSNGDGTYLITKKSTSGELYMQASCNLPAGTYTYTWIVDGTDTTNTAWVKLTGGGTTSYQTMTRTVKDGKTYYTKTLTATSTVTAILVDIQSSSGYAASGWAGNVAVVVSSGSTSKEFTTPVGARMNIQSAYSSIEQTASAISSKVEKNGVISAINQSAEGLTIDAGKVDINLSGYVTISSLGASGTTTVNGSRIYGGTLTLGGSDNGNGRLVVRASASSRGDDVVEEEVVYDDDVVVEEPYDGHDIIIADNTGLSIYCVDSNTAFSLRSASGVNYLTANNSGITVYHGSITGGTISGSTITGSTILGSTIKFTQNNNNYFEMVWSGYSNLQNGTRVDYYRLQSVGNSELTISAPGHPSYYYNGVWYARGDGIRLTSTYGIRLLSKTGGYASDPSAELTIEGNDNSRSNSGPRATMTYFQGTGASSKGSYQIRVDSSGIRFYKFMDGTAESSWEQIASWS